MVIELDFASDTPIYVQLRNQIELLSAEASITGMDKEEFLKMCENIYSKMNPCTM